MYVAAVFFGYALDFVVSNNIASCEISKIYTGHYCRCPYFLSEKLAIMVCHLKDLKADRSLLSAERILHDSEGTSCLREYVSKEKHVTLIRDYVVPILREYLNHSMEQPGMAFNVKKILDIAVSYMIDSSELEVLRQKARGITT